ncbi:hypothetical protein H632_c1343p1 [Helicosporidium sp. ATCC 50920]|nr:hypothetical protein H632_c1343p1 [Helicosporidium sp. ATCC 50920]|eukprot:KDD74398.1 hypothetical protein H632_c1343p1 [Helicosporidium sp. ATCC 50920]
MASKWLAAHAEEVQAHSAKVLEDATPPPLETILAREGEHWRPSDETVDRDLLTARDPILLYDELRLYDSELEDNGLASLTVKVRVMPRCWYVLMRFFVRVDGVLVRVRDVRLFCRFDGRDFADRVLRETTHFERPLAGQPHASRAYKDADASAAVLQASAPDHVNLYLVERLNLS